MTEFLIQQLGRMVWPVGRSGRLAVLMYHRVLSEPDPLRSWDVDVTQFEMQMRLLRRRFNVLPLSEAVDRLKQGKLPRLAVSITFDDGYRDNHDIALPILLKYGLPATFFIATGYLDGGCMFNDHIIEAVRLNNNVIDLERHGLGRYSVSTLEDKISAIGSILPKLKYQPFEVRTEIGKELAKNTGLAQFQDMMMSTSQVKALRNAGMSVGAHTVKHPILANEPIADAERDILESKQFLEELLDEAVDIFAYPNGRPGEDYRREHVDLLEKLGFSYAVSTAWGLADGSSDRFQIPRLLPWDKALYRFQARIIRELWGDRAKQV